MGYYKIFYCPRCKTLLYCSNQQKTKICPRCQKNIQMKNQNILKTTATTKEAIILIQNLKLPINMRNRDIKSQNSSVEIKSKHDKLLNLIYEIQKNSDQSNISEKSFLVKAKEADLSEDWILAQLMELEKQGLLIRPQKDVLQFLL